MVTNNKVLTVSYGTFSCTLEGFEDSFDTMKAIAEYFRDLAGDDRYFGAEPPTPDAEMLARIAEREIERRVQARVDHGAIVLSAASPTPAAADPVKEETIAEPVAEPVVETEPADEAPVEDVEETAEVPEIVDVTDEILTDEVIEAPAQSADESVSDDLVDETVADDLVDDVAAQDTAASQEVEVADVLAAVAADTAVEPTTETEEAAEEQVAVPDLEAAFEEQDFDLTNVQQAVAFEDAKPEIAEPEMVEAVEEEVVEVRSEGFAQDEEDVADAEEVSEAVSEATDLDSISEQLNDAEEEDEIDLFAEDQDRSEADVELEDVADAQEKVFADWEDDDTSEDAAPEFEENSIAAKLERIRAVVSRVENDPEDDFSEDEHAEDFQQEDNILADLEDTAQQDDEDDADISPFEAEAASSNPLRARVVRMKKADFEEAVASGLLEAEPVDEDEEEDAPVANGSSLTPEDEADLLAELAEVEAELKRADANEATAAEAAVAEAETDAAFEQGADEDQAPDPAPESKDDTSAKEAAFVLTEPVLTLDQPEEQIADEEATPQEAKPVAKGEDDLSRLMAKAESEMEEPEGNRRRRAIAHLRAAVKATKAEKDAGSDLTKRDVSNIYRDDLASVVRAVPADDKADKPRATAERPSAPPLKLVAEQRIDSPEPAAEAAEEVIQDDTTPRVPVRPRRVSTDRKDREEIARSAAPVGSSSASKGGFIDYAQSVGASRLPEILEAAAAYVTFVEGHDRFSRPMLMRLARDANEEDFSREVGLRSFGQLLREKKIEKIAGGRFTANASINYKPDDRAVG
ncbi:hypothetical protein [Shimia sp.]|uniref:hypothetical protein n=1 Tax=Shimia sp. TaxID=1954381 RepID=UPI00329853CC